MRRSSGTLGEMANRASSLAVAQIPIGVVRSRGDIFLADGDRFFHVAQAEQNFGVQLAQVAFADICGKLFDQRPWRGRTDWRSSSNRTCCRMAVELGRPNWAALSNSFSAALFVAGQQFEFRFHEMQFEPIRPLAEVRLVKVANLVERCLI